MLSKLLQPSNMLTIPSSYSYCIPEAGGTPPQLCTFDVLKWLKSICRKLLQPENMPLMFVTYDVFRFSIPTISTNDLKPENQLRVVEGRAFLKDG